MTSNRPEILDKALIRPGRIDVSVKFGCANRKLIVEMYESFFGSAFPEHLTNRLPDEKLTAAEVGQVLFRNFKNPDPEVVMRDLDDSSTVEKQTFSVKYMPSEPLWEPQEEIGDQRYATWEP